MFGSIGMPELIIIFVIALIIFGPRKLPELGRSLGKSLSEFKRASNELRSTLEEEIRLEEQRATREARGHGSPDGQRNPGAARRRAGPRSSRRPERLARKPFHGPRAFSGPPVGGLQHPPDEPTTTISPRPDGKMSFLEHLDELRKRIIRACIGVARRRRRRLLRSSTDLRFRPRADAPGAAGRRKLIYTQPGEAFSLYVTVALIAGVVVASPFIMYQVWMFIAPGLYSNEKKIAYPVRRAHDARLRRWAPRSITTSRSRS